MADLHEVYVSRETAKLLKDSGFNWDVRQVYTKDGWSDVYPEDWNNKPDAEESVMSMPTLTVAHKWLRDVKDVVLDVEYDILSKNYHTRYCVLNPFITPNWKHLGSFGRYSTYEEALEAGIKSYLVHYQVVKSKPAADWVTEANMEAADDMVDGYLKD